MTPTSEIKVSTEMTRFACESFKNISYSRNDTKETRGEIVEHNAVYDSICLEYNNP